MPRKKNLMDEMKTNNPDAPKSPCQPDPRAANSQNRTGTPNTKPPVATNSPGGTTAAGAGNASAKSAAAPKDFENLTESQEQAMMVQDRLIPAIMQMAIAPRGTVDSDTVRGYRDEMLREMGNPSDPLERMMIEQAAVAHVMVLQFHSFTALAKSSIAAGVYANAAAKLMAELRKMILGVREYRSPMARPQVTKSEQQNVAERQEVHYTAGAGGDVQMACREKLNPDSKLASNGEEVTHANPGDGEIPGSRIRWDAEPAVAGAADGCGASTAS
jgi:hypothetical protein